MAKKKATKKTAAKKASPKKPAKKAASKPAPKAATNSSDGKACAILAYFFVGIIWYFVDNKMKKNQFANFHVKQSIILFLTSIVGAIVINIVSLIAIIGDIIAIVINLGILVLWILGLINAINGKKKELPIIGCYSSKLNF